MNDLRLSVVIPTYRRPDLLRRCLRALARQDLDPGTFEVIVCDDAAKANAAKADAAETETQRLVWDMALRRVRLEQPPLFRYLPITHAHGPAAARNAGWRAAQGEIIAFTDDDCIPAPDWLSAGLRAFDHAPANAAVSGRVIVPLPPDPTDYELDAAGLNQAEFVTANCFCRRRVLESVGGFDEQFPEAWREDSDLQFTLLERGYTIGPAAQAVVVHPIRPAPWGAELKMQHKSKFEALLYKKHPRLYRQRIRAKPLWNYYGMAAALGALLISLFTGKRRVILLAGGLWLSLTTRFTAQRLQHTSHAPRHISEMVVTSTLIPVLSVFWTLVGAIKYRVLFS